MKPRRWLWAALAAALFGVYGYRAVVGIRAGLRFDRAQWLYGYTDYAAAIPILDEVSIGSNRLHAARLAAEARLELWEADLERGGALAADPELLRRAGEAFLVCRCIAPASRRSWEGLAEVYGHMEWTGREARSLESFDPSLHGWQRVGRPGRIAIGMIRGGLRMAPNWFALLDDLASKLWAFGIEDEAEQALRAAALSLPLHQWHRLPAEQPQRMLDIFAEASHEVVGQVALIRTSEHLLDLAKLDLLRGRSDLAVESLTRALEERTDDLATAEIEYYLGTALLGRGEVAEGRRRLLSAARHPAFRRGAMQDLARHAESTGDFASALEFLRRLRQDEPRDLGLCMSFARVAREVGDWPAVVDTLRWACLVHPTDPLPHLELVRAHIETGNIAAAESLLHEIEVNLAPPAGAIAELRHRIEQVELGGGTEAR